MTKITVLTYIELACSWLVAHGHLHWFTIGDKRKHYKLSDIVEMAFEFVKENPEFILEIGDSETESKWVESASDGNIKVDFKKGDISLRPLFTRENGMDYYKERANDTFVEWIRSKYFNIKN